MFIDQDLHLHTNYSRCADPNVTLADYLRQAKALGLTALGVSNHFWDERIPGAIPWYQSQGYDHICQLKREIAEQADCGIRVLFGAETEYDYARRGIAITEERAAALDYLLVPNSHTHITMPKEFVSDRRRFADYMYAAYEDILDSPVSRYVTAIAHPFYAVSCPFNNEELLPMIDDERYRRIFERTARQGIAMEINTSCFVNWSVERIRRSPFLHLFALGKQCGCRFVVGSDAHRESAMPEQAAIGYVIAAMLELTDRDLLRI